jgi:hypothetical protein
MQKVIQYFFKIFIIGIVLSFVIAGFFWALQWMEGRNFEWSPEFAKEILYYLVYGVSLTTVNSLFFDYLNKEVDWTQWEQPKKYRIIIGVVGGVVLTLLTIFLIRFVIYVAFEQHSVASFLNNERPQFYFVSLMITLVITLFFHAVYFYNKTQENRVKEQKIIAGTASAQFESLKNQIDPHFLFNSLNVLSSLIEENQENAQKFTASLSKIYRYVLEQKDKELVSVEEELNFAKTYMELLTMRFENSVFFEIPTIVSNPEAKVVPLSMQLLLENTVKHNVASERKPLHIRVYEQDEYLVVENDFQKKEVLQERKGVGLQNIISRYAIVSDRKVKIETTDQHFKVALPMLTKQILVMETLDNNEHSIYLKAQKKVEDLKGFYGNLSMYVIVILGLAILNLVTYPKHLWFLYPAMGWGIGVAIHGMAVFNYMPFLGKSWEEKKIKELMEKEKSNKWS